MSQIKKHTWKGLAVAAAMLLSVGLMTQTVFAATTAGAPANTFVPLGSNPVTGGGGYVTFGSDIVLTSGAIGDFAVASDIVISAPAGFEFNPAAVVAVTKTGTVTVATPAVVTASTITVDVTLASAALDTVTLDTNGPLLIRATGPGTAPNGTVAAPTAYAVTAVTAGGSPTVTNVWVTGIRLTSNVASVTSDGTTSTTITASAFDSAGAALPNTLVNLTTNRGTLSATSNTTSSTALTTGGSNAGTVTFRGNGTTGVANITATTAAPNAATNGINITVTAPTVTPTQIAFRDATNSAHIAASLSTQYTTPTNSSRVRFVTSNAAGTGVNNQLIQATVDKGYIASGDTPGACAGSNTSASINTATVVIDTVDVDGTATFTVCARAGQVGPIKVTAKNLSTTMPDASTTVTSAGIPNKIEAVVSGGTVTATIKDKDGNEVADGTTVTFGVPSFTGTVAPACTTTSNGKAAASAAFSGTGGQVLITVFYNDSGNAPASTCAALGNVAGASTTVTVGAGAPPAPGAALILGTVPSAGRFGLIGVASATTVDALIAAATTAGCNVTSLSITSAASASGWLVHIKGAPAAVNTSFPGTAAVPAGGAGLLCG